MRKKRIRGGGPAGRPPHLMNMYKKDDGYVPKRADYGPYLDYNQRKRVEQLKGIIEHIRKKIIPTLTNKDQIKVEQLKVKYLMVERDAINKGKSVAAAAKIASEAANVSAASKKKSASKKKKSASKRKSKKK
mgnify:CR=1 FL=1